MVDTDVIVIGSGAGGLTSALALAQSGLRVLVLEQHYVPGGWCHSFQLGGYRFSPGVHYIGELGEGGRMRQVYDGLGVSRDLTFLELNPDGYDHVIIGDERFDIPKGRSQYIARLKSRFPAESKNIDRYFDLIDNVVQQVNFENPPMGLVDHLRMPFKSPQLVRHGLRSLGSVLNSFFDDPHLKAILSIQAGDHGARPAEAPFALHAAVVSHYFGGGWYPKGGAYTIPRAFVRALKRAGGEVRLRTSVERVLIENRSGRPHAIGVRLDDGTEIRSHRVISNADPTLTFRSLVGTGHLSSRLKRRLDRTRYSISALSLFGAVDADVKKMGLDSGNYWFSRTTDIDATYRTEEGNTALDHDELPGVFLTMTTLKDPAKEKSGHHTFEAFSLVPFDTFRKWSSSNFGERPEDYGSLKEELSTRMLTAINRIVPGFSDRVVFKDLGTPLTNVHYIRATGGNLYGTEKNRWQVGPFSYDVGTEIGDLYLCGASTVGHGVMGATISGLVAAGRILGVRPTSFLRDHGHPLRTYLADDVSSWPKDMRRKLSPMSSGTVRA